jgi:Flp pilus assembly pilin Flp
MMTRHRRDARGASVIEYVLLLAMVALVVFAAVYALGRSPERPASVLGETFNSGPAAGGPGPTPGSTIPPCPPATSPTTTTTAPCTP